MAGSKAKSKRTVGEWEAEIDTRDKRIGLLELAIYDLQFAVGYGTTEPKFGKPVEVEVRHTEHGMERGLKLQATIYRTKGADPWVMVVQRGDGVQSCDVFRLDPWLQRMREDATVPLGWKLLADRAAIAWHRYLDGREPAGGR